MLHDWSGGAIAIILRCNVTHLLVTSVKVLDFKHQTTFSAPLNMAAGGGQGTRLNIVAPTNTMTSTIVIRTRPLYRHLQKSQRKNCPSMTHSEFRDRAPRQEDCWYALLEDQSDRLAPFLMDILPPPGDCPTTTLACFHFTH